jgi:hypothetical protein
MAKFRGERYPSLLNLSFGCILTSLKGEDDGSVFAHFLKESRFPPHLKSITWENVKEIMDAYKVLQFTKWRLSLTPVAIVYSVL